MRAGRQITHMFVQFYKCCREGKRESSVDNADNCRWQHTNAVFEIKEAFLQKSWRMYQQECHYWIYYAPCGHRKYLITVKTVKYLLQVNLQLVLLWLLLLVLRSLWPRRNPQRQPKKTQAAWKSFGSSVETSTLVVGNSVTFHSKMQSTLMCLQKLLSVPCFCYHDGKDDYCCLNANQTQECLGIVQVIAIMSSELFEVISCVTSWYHDPFAVQISSSIIGGKDDFIFKYCCNTLCKRMRASMACEYHKTTGDHLAFSLFFPLRCADSYFSFREIWLLWILPETQSHCDLI